MKPSDNQSSITPPSDPERRHLPVWKRCIDLVCCLLALPFLALLSLVMAIVTRLVAPGPVFFRQERVGHRGGRFRIYKFRTMYVDADSQGHENYGRELIRTNAPMIKLDTRGDARLIPGSWLLRASGLDELPQIINVLRGEMTVVGPRPCLPAEYAEYQPRQRRRCEAVPGLTGLWQVSGKNRTTFEEMICLDIHYSETISCWLDLKIILATVPALVVQICEIRNGRRTTSASAYTIPPFSMQSVPARSAASVPPPRAISGRA
jgi:lipopolysaccharide/colanic/teichoic acid biosynthesis glycosyltransferase